MENKTVALVLLIRGDFATAAYAFATTGLVVKKKEAPIEEENEIQEAAFVDETEVELHVGVYVGCDFRIEDFFKPLCKSFTYFSPEQNTAQVYNELFRKCETQYICIIQPHISLQKRWLHELLFYSDYIKGSGVVSIASSFLNLHYQPQLSVEENLISVFLDKEPSVNCAGILFFSRQHLYLIGRLDERREVEENEFLQFQLRAHYSGYVNFYTPSQTCILLKYPPFFDQARRELMQQTIGEMASVKSFYLPL